MALGRFRRKSRSEFLPEGMESELATLNTGWGRKPSGMRAVANARKSGSQAVLLEDGFLRSVERDGRPLSIVTDDVGIYYDCYKPSRLEALVQVSLTEVQEARTRNVIEAWRRNRISKYNHAREYAGRLPDHYVLVCEQTFGDASVQYGRGNRGSFERMLEAACRENPNCVVVVKRHPDVVSGRKKGYLHPDTLARFPRILLISDDVHAACLLEHSRAVYVVTSQMGFEALLWGKPVRCFGMPFYAGWGLTHDEAPKPSRRADVSLNQLVHATLIEYPTYVDPETGMRWEV